MALYEHISLGKRGDKDHVIITIITNSKVATRDESVIPAD